ncbi:hypothetical protein ONZ45_g16483 [Pleurotus djamor]|nr:hypothetical protein ONZ45_g16483 [Pleurotus djamor]
MAGQNNNNFGVGTVNVVNAGAIQINQICSHGATQIKAVPARVSELGRTAAHQYQGIIDSIAGICQVLGELCPLYDPVLTPLHSVMTNLHGIVGYVVSFLSVIDEAPDISKLGHFDRDLLAYNQYIHPLNCAGFWRGICLFVFAHFRWGTPIRNLQNFVMSHQIPLEQFSRFFESRSWDTIIKGQMGVRLESLVRASALLQTPTPTTLQPLKLTVMNHLGDYLPIPLEFCLSLEDIRIVIKRWCRNQPGDNFIRSDSWELVHPETNNSINQFMFPRLAKPQTVFAMSIVLGRRGQRPYHCPNCGEDNRRQARDNGWVNCSNCYLLFTVSHESPLEHNPPSFDISKIIRDKILRKPAVHVTSLKHEVGTQSKADIDHKQETTGDPILVADVSRFKRVTVRVHQVQTTHSDVIVLLSPVCADKFGNIAAGSHKFKMGSSLACCTNDVQIQACKNPKDGRPVLLIDTPAFNHDKLSLKEIVAKLKKQLRKQKKIHRIGILYLRRITDVRLNEDPFQNLHRFEDVCGSAGKVIFVTTMWDLISLEEGIRREAEFQRRSRLHGSCIKRSQGTLDSAWEIINAVLEQSRP